MSSPDGVKPSEEPPPRFAAYLDPPDRTTSIGAGPLRLSLIRVGSGDATQGQTAVDALADALTIETWPEGQSVPAARTVRLATGPSNLVATIELAPIQALTDRWYAVRQTGLPDGITVSTDHRNWPHPVSGIMSRFRPGEETVVSSVYRAIKAGKATSVGVSFSESVIVKSLAEAIVVESASGSVYLCSAQPNNVASVREIVVICDSAVLLPFRVRTGAGIANSSGERIPETIVDFAAGDYLKACGEDCFLKQP